MRQDNWKKNMPELDKSPANTADTAIKSEVVHG